MDQNTLTNKEKAIISAISSAVTGGVGYGLLPPGTPEVVSLIGAAVLAVTAAVYAVKHLLNPTA
jgi:hypothetical protein